MPLYTSHKTAQETITNLIESGYSMRKRMQSDYSNLRTTNQFDPVKHVAQWSNEYRRWYDSCLQDYQKIFTTKVELSELDIAQGGAIYESGQNVQWIGLRNRIDAKLSVLREHLKDIDKKPREINANTPPAKLANTIATHFTDTDLELLCANLGTRIDLIVKGGTTQNKALDIVDHYIGESRVEELLTQLERIRPEVNWREIYK